MTPRALCHGDIITVSTYESGDLVGIVRGVTIRPRSAVIVLELHSGGRRSPLAGPNEPAFELASAEVAPLLPRRARTNQLRHRFGAAGDAGPAATCDRIEHLITQGGAVASKVEQRSTAVSRDERARRAAESRHSLEIEGLRPTPASDADADSYVRGEISAPQMVRRARARYGLER